jgi:deoxycytidylate deaminase
MEYLSGHQEEEAVTWMNEAARVAQKALCLKSRCGTVIVNDGEIIGEGYNAPPLDKGENSMCKEEYVPGKPKYDKTCCMHAEWRAILDALKKNPTKIIGSKLYFVRVDNEGHIKKSGEPYCTVCSRMALDVGIDKFLLWHEKGIGEYGTEEYNQMSYNYKPTE